jgi:membrane protease YdiL (CAAX protease family)
MTEPGPGWGSAPPTGPPSGWYPDPSRLAQYRYWDGQQWTPTVAVDGSMFIRPLPPVPTPAWTAPPEEPDRRVHLPARAGGYAAAGLLAGFVGSMVVGYGIRAVAPDARLAILLPSQAALWTGLIGACILASRRYGTGRLSTDYGWRMEPVDIGWGLLFSIVGRIAASLAVAPIVVLSRRFVGSNDRILREFKAHPVEFIAIGLIAVVGAPIVEELFFRGLLQQVLTTRWGPAVGIVGQAVVFGLCHISPLVGLGNVSVVVAIAVFGLVQGLLAHSFKRLGPSTWSHVFFNLVAIVVALALL